MGNSAPSIVFAGGGTGGHLFPALAVAAELRRRHPECAIEFVGARRGIEQRLVPRAGYPLRSLSLSGLKGRGPLARTAAAAAAGWAVLRCVLWLRRLRPDIVIGVGGYASGPAVLAARFVGLRTMVMEQNHFPGATNRWLAPRVDAVCLPSEAARKRLGGRGIVTGNPVRREFVDIGEAPGDERSSLLVFGGSRGARSINRALMESLERLARIDPAPAIVHQTGADDEEEVRRAYVEHYPEELYEVVGFVDDMARRVAAADLVICRAGATTLAELAAAGRPAILVPYPWAADDHQRHNAEAVRDAGAARVVLDGELDGESLARHVAELAANRPALTVMGRAARGLARPDAALRIADVARSLIDGHEVDDVP